MLRLVLKVVAMMYKSVVAFFILLFVFFVVTVLGGCAGYNQAVTAGLSSAGVSLQTAEDNNIRLWKFNACATPLSAALRNPMIIPGLRALCLPGGVDTSLGSLLPMPVQALQPVVK